MCLQMKESPHEYIYAAVLASGELNKFKIGKRLWIFNKHTLFLSCRISDVSVLLDFRMDTASENHVCSFWKWAYGILEIQNENDIVMVMCHIGPCLGDM